MLRRIAFDCCAISQFAHAAQTKICVAIKQGRAGDDDEEGKDGL
jgi:hypothetical protein